MKINGFKIKNQKIQKIWISVTFALIVAVILITISFFLIFKKSSEINEGDLFEFTSYYTKYNVTTYSNKNQNTYSMEEYCIKNNSDVKFRFNTLNEDNNYSYIVTNNSFHIKSENQISEFKNSINMESNTNILSLATFIDIYVKVNDMIKENTFSNNGVEVLVEEKDKRIRYIVLFKEKTGDFGEMALYKEALVNGMKISKLELILDMDTKEPIEYIVYLENGNAYIDITYTEFKINAKFDEKVFSF